MSSKNPAEAEALMHRASQSFAAVVDILASALRNENLEASLIDIDGVEHEMPSQSWNSQRYQIFYTGRAWVRAGQERIPGAIVLRHRQVEAFIAGGPISVASKTFSLARDEKAIAQALVPVLQLAKSNDVRLSKKVLKELVKNHVPKLTNDEFERIRNHQVLKEFELERSGASTKGNTNRYNPVSGGYKKAAARGTCKLI